MLPGTSWATRPNSFPRGLGRDPCGPARSFPLTPWRARQTRPCCKHSRAGAGYDLMWSGSLAGRRRAAQPRNPVAQLSLPRPPAPRVGVACCFAAQRLSVRLPRGCMAPATPRNRSARGWTAIGAGTSGLPRCPVSPTSTFKVRNLTSLKGSTHPALSVGGPPAGDNEGGYPSRRPMTIVSRPRIWPPGRTPSPLHLSGGNAFTQGNLPPTHLHTIPTRRPATSGSPSTQGNQPPTQPPHKEISHPRKPPTHTTQSATFTPSDTGK